MRPKPRRLLHSGYGFCFSIPKLGFLGPLTGTPETSACRLISSSSCSSSSSSSYVPPSLSIIDILQKEYGSAPSLDWLPCEGDPQKQFSKRRQAFVEESMVAVNEIIRGADATVVGPLSRKNALKSGGANATPARNGQRADSAGFTTASPSIDLAPSVDGSAQSLIDQRESILGRMPRIEVIGFLMDRLRAKRWLELDIDMRTYKIELLPSHVVHVLRLLKNVITAWDFFRWASVRPGYKHNSACYAVMIERLGRSSEIGLLDALLSCMERNQVPHSLATISSLIGIYTAISQFDKADQAFAKLKTLGLQPTMSINKCMLQVSLGSGNFLRALETYRTMEEDTPPLDTQVFNKLLDGLVNIGQVEAVWDIFDRRKKSGSVADSCTYHALARTLNDGRLGNKALKLLEELDSNGVEPSKYVLTAILMALTKQDKVDEVMNLFKKMISNGLQPDYTFYEAIVKMLCKARQQSLAMDALEGIEDMVLKKEVYESFIKVFSRMGSISEALSLFQKLEDESLKPDSTLYLCIIDALCRSAEPDKALELVKNMEQSGFECNITSCNSMIVAFCNKNEPEISYNLFKRLKERGLSPNVATYNSLITGLIKVGKSEVAEGLLVEMGTSGCMPNVVTCNAFLHGYAQLGDAESTHRLLHLMKAKEISPDGITCNYLIQLFCKAGKPEMALSVLSEMEEKGFSPSLGAYNNALRAFAKAGLTEALVSLFQQMTNQGIKPDAATYEVINGVCERFPLRHKLRVSN